MERRNTDPLTGEIFTPSRSDQKFASRQNQIRYNNLKAKNKRKAKAEIDRTLDNNRSILKRILGDKKQIIKSRDYLLGAEFHFGITTHKIERDGKLWSCIYEYMLTPTEKDLFLISVF